MASGITRSMVLYHWYISMIQITFTFKSFGSDFKITILFVELVQSLNFKLRTSLCFKS